jgi:hypothetical protein
MSQPAEFNLHFHTPFHQTGTIDEQQCVIHGVSIMQGNLTAEGHDLEVDRKTLEQVLTLGKAKGQIPVKLNHGSGVENLNGHIDGKSMWLDLSVPSEPKVRGDWHLGKKHRDTPHMLDMAKTQPGTFGMSAAFKGGGEKQKTGKNAARCTELKAVDCVTDPAANKGGLFSAQDSTVIHFSVKPAAKPVDSRAKAMPEDPNNTTAATSQQAEQAPAWFTAWTKQNDERLAKIEGFQNEVMQNLNQPDLLELAQMSEQQIRDLGLDPADVIASVQSAIDAGELTLNADGSVSAPADGSTVSAQGADGGGDGAAAGAAAGAGAPASTSMQSTFSVARQAARQEIQMVQREAREFAEQQQAEHAFAVIADKVTELSTQNEKLTTELQSKDAEIKALKMTLRTANVRNPGATGETIFSAKTTEPGTYEHVVKTEFDRLIAAKVKEVDAKVKAFEFGIKKHPALYEEFKQRNGKTIELSAK